MKILGSASGGFLLVIGVGKDQEVRRFDTWRQAKNAGERLRRRGLEWVYPDQYYFN